MIPNKNFTIVDVETTGGRAGMHRVIEIGILRVEKGELVNKFKSLINPGRDIPEFIESFTGISTKKVKNAPFFEEIAEDIFPLFEDSIFVAHNSSFDYKFLQFEFSNAGFAFHMDTLCTVRLSSVLYPEFKRHNLSALIDRFDLKCKNRHRAFDDAKVLWDFMRIVQKDFPAAHVSVALDRTMKKISPKKQQKMSLVAEPELEYIADSFKKNSAYKNPPLCGGFSEFKV